ncbi:conjugal transfer protein TrbG [Caenimonas sedimenti]|uniref:Conjugal transfer protein TrbG n=1 Tax=Caenimonas sedimenti TaxID=2596921 RepID=A0A562ZSQ4_9BURK|nr:TrbG/VirB9 family P-type conjugative transfer protein [Caenimonas sedimenti]TWO71437.1 conjugal transfer protein TrbG [Caenimonas sedimenti]
MFASIAPAGAELVATPLRGDSRLVEFAYDADNTFLLLAKPLAVTHVQFAADEQIQTVVAGDNANWELSPAKNRKHLFVKPKYDGQETSMTVITDRRSYQFVLRSTGDGKKWYQRVSWVYPSELVVDYEVREPSSPRTESTPQQQGALGAGALGSVNGLPGLRPEALRFNYEVHGDAPFRPLVVFDDGQFTYMKLPASIQELPALLAVTDEKEYGLVNFEVKGDYLVAHRLLPVAVLKLGRAEVRVQQVAPKRNFLGFTVQN